MKSFSAHWARESVICCGHKGYVIEDYFANYFLHTMGATFDIPLSKREVIKITRNPGRRVWWTLASTR
jgi:glucose-1-phosphate cytidylyltransferase